VKKTQIAIPPFKDFNEARNVVQNALSGLVSTLVEDSKNTQLDGKGLTAQHLATPILPDDAATKEYVDRALQSGLPPKSVGVLGDFQLANASSQLSLTAGFQDVPGCALTCQRSGTYLIQGNFFFIASGTSSQIFAGALLANGVQPTGFAITQENRNGFYSAASQQWLLPMLGGQILKLQALSLAGVGKTETPHTSITILWVGP